MEPETPAEKKKREDEEKKRLARVSMEQTLKRALQVPQAAAKAFVEEAGGPMEAAEVVLSWTEDTQPVKYVKREPVRRAFLIEKLRSWADEFRALEFLNDSSLFELQVTTEVNCTYPCLVSKRVSLKACLELRDRLGMTLDQNTILYAVLYKLIDQKKVATREELETAAQLAGVVFVEPTTLKPFSKEIFENHPLEGVDVDRVPISTIMKAMPGKGIAAIRERRNMRNRIVRVGQGKEERFKFDEGVSKLAKMMHALKGPVKD